MRVLSEDLDPSQLDLIRERPELHRTISASLRYNPELVLALDCIAGPDGLVHAMQLHPTARLTSSPTDSADFDHAVRWISRSDGRDALGLLLPSTAEPEGYEAENAKGNLKVLASSSAVSFAVEFGALGRQEAVGARDRDSRRLVGGRDEHRESHRPANGTGLTDTGNAAKRIDSILDQKRSELEALIAALVGINSQIPPHGDEREIARFLTKAMADTRVAPGRDTRSAPRPS